MKKQRIFSILFTCLLFLLLTALVLASCLVPEKTFYFVFFDANGGSNAPNKIIFEAGYGITLPYINYSNYRNDSVGEEMEKYGCTFVRWNTNNSGTGTNYDAGQFLKPDGDITLYAVWKEIDSIPLIENVWANGSTTPNNKTVFYTFSVINGRTYNIWLNARYQEDSSKTAVVYVNADYIDGSSIFSQYDINGGRYGGERPDSFTANTNGIVKLSVTSYHDFGTFAIVYSTGSTRPDN